MAYTSLSSLVAKRLAQMQGTEQPKAEPEPSYSLKQISAMERPTSTGTPKPYFRQTPAQFWKSLRALKRAGR